jgi:hypothetical protein
MTEARLKCIEKKLNRNKEIKEDLKTIEAYLENGFIQKVNNDYMNMDARY